MRRGLIVLIVLLLVGVGVASAQDEIVEPQCKTTSLNFIITALRTTADGVEEDVQNETSPIVSLRLLQAQIAGLLAECRGLSFSSDTDGMQPVLGPITLPEGIYRATVTTTGFFIGDIELIDGECESTGFGSVFNLSPGQADAGAQAVIRSAECRMLFPVENTREPWTLIFEPIQ